MTLKSETITHYATDCAGCDCRPTHKLAGIPCISVTRTVDYIHPAKDTCDGCGQSWPSREFRSEKQPSLKLNVPCERYAQRGVLCVPDGDACAQCGNVAA